MQNELGVEYEIIEESLSGHTTVWDYPVEGVMSGKEYLQPCLRSQRYAWDAEAGYFGYVCHSPEGEPLEILRHASGQNYNMGLDGVSPLVAGICDAE